jgi:hypothetical protein
MGRVMRCFFMRGGHIQAVEELPGLSDEEAVEKARQMFDERKAARNYDGFEVWFLDRMVIQCPPVQAKFEADVIPFPPRKSG